MNGTTDKALQERQKYVQAFNATMIKIWREQIALLGVIDTGALYRSTLAVRMNRHNESSQKGAAGLSTHPKVKEVFYVGFPDHKGYEITKRQTKGFGGMISFTVDSLETVKKILKNVSMVMFAESLGGTETLITYPTTQTHEDTPKALKEDVGITECFLRLSVGLEDAQDIINDLEQAMR